MVLNDVVGGILTRVTRRLRLPLPDLLRVAYNGMHPEIVYYDTGAEVYEELRFHREQLFVGMPAHLHERYVTHFSGVSRHVVQGGGTAVATIAGTVIERLRTRYGVDATR